MGGLKSPLQDNVGFGSDITIAELAGAKALATSYQGELVLILQSLMAPLGSGKIPVDRISWDGIGK